MLDILYLNLKSILGRSKPSENECFCYDEPENDMDYGICQKPSGPSGEVMIHQLPYFQISKWFPYQPLFELKLYCVSFPGILQTVYKRI